MLIETWIDRWLAKIHPRKTFAQLFAEDKQREVMLAEATKEAIRRQQYDLHMCIAKIEAMDDWLYNRNVRKDFK